MNKIITLTSDKSKAYTKLMFNGIQVNSELGALNELCLEQIFDLYDHCDEKFSNVMAVHFSVKMISNCDVEQTKAIKAFFYSLRSQVIRYIKEQQLGPRDIYLFGAKSLSKGQAGSKTKRYKLTLMVNPRLFIRKTGNRTKDTATGLSKLKGMIGYCWSRALQLPKTDYSLVTHPNGNVQFLNRDIDSYPHRLRQLKFELSELALQPTPGMSKANGLCVLFHGVCANKKK
ncbi:inovirus-type Gp2 protein [Vibrio sp. TBV020]|uniref:YagK/YfjJ domain-containing protein n=1 Tax=Vibrio sp. TBV020 TaxID=3137398 RepID=UPI0038CD5287